jgi:thymidylate kinase
MKKGIYILVEGLSGSGKSSRAMDIFKLLKEKGIPAIFNSQPTKKNPFGLVIRELIEGRKPSRELLIAYEEKVEKLGQILLNRSYSLEDQELIDQFIQYLGVVPDLVRADQICEISEWARQNIFCADGFFDLVETILPALEKGECVVQDRERTSSLAYGAAHGVPFEENLKIHQLVIGEFYRKPDVFLYIDASPEICIEHLIKSGKLLDVYEKKESLEKIIDEYEMMIVFLRKIQKLDTATSFV